MKLLMLVGLELTVLLYHFDIHKSVEHFHNIVPASQLKTDFNRALKTHENGVNITDRPTERDVESSWTERCIWL